MNELIEARDKVAKFISLYKEEGEKCLPIFERLEREIALLEAREAVKNRALNIVTRNATPNAPQIGHHSGNI